MGNDGSSIRRSQSPRIYLKDSTSFSSPNGLGPLSAEPSPSGVMPSSAPLFASSITTPRAPRVDEAACGGPEARFVGDDPPVGFRDDRLWFPCRGVSGDEAI